MLPNVAALVKDDAAVSALVGAGTDCRIYRHGRAPQGVAYPYLTWFVVAGSPDNTLSNLPTSDATRIQINVFSKDDAEVESLAKAVRDAIEPQHDLELVAVDDFDSETQTYHFAMIFSFWEQRA